MNKVGFTDTANCSVKAKKEMETNLTFHGWCRVECRDSEGNLKWVDEGSNIVVNTGIDYILGTGILDSSTLYVGLHTASPALAAGNTMTEAAAAEAAGYDEATRPLWGQDAAASQAVTNSTAVDFTMDGNDVTIGGAFITTDNTKDGTGGILIASKAFTGGNKTVADNDVLSVTYTITGSSS